MSLEEFSLPNLEVQQSKHLKLNKRVVKVVLVILLIIVLAFLLFSWFLSRNNINLSTTPSAPSNNTQTLVPAEVFPDIVAITGANQEWQFKTIQPILKDFKSVEDKNYLVVSYNDYRSNEILEDILVTGVAPDGAELEVIYYSSEEGKELVNFEQLKSLLRIGAQIRVDYLSTAPSSDIMTAEYCNMYRDFCTLTKFNDVYRAIKINKELFR